MGLPGGRHPRARWAGAQCLIAGRRPPLPIAADGSLGAEIAGSPFVSGTGATDIALDPTGKFAYVTNQNANTLSAYTINASSGALTPVSGSPFATTYIPATFAVHPNGTLVYTFNKSVSGSSPMEAFQLDTSSGALTALSTSPFMTMTAFSGKFDQTGGYLFLHSTDTLAVASVNTTTGALTSLRAPVTGVGSAPAWAVTDPH